MKIININSTNPVYYWLVIIGIPVLFLLGSILHFVYDWSGNLTFVGIFAPINESIWEHLKLSFWPMLCWWLGGYILFNKVDRIDSTKWFVGCTTALIACPLAIISFYYTYTGALGIHSLILDIFSLFLGLLVGQKLGFHIYKFTEPPYFCLPLSIVISILLILAFTIFTFIPPHIPLFQDPLTGKYGI